MIEHLPTARPFIPSKLRWHLVDSTVEGPESFGLPTDVQSTDGGGWWVAELADMQAGSSLHHRAMRALAMRSRGGRVFSVPYLEQSPTGGLAQVPFAEGVTFSTGALFTVGVMTAVLEEAVELRDDEALIRVLTGQSLLGADMFSLTRSNGRPELHGCETAVEVEPGLWSVRIAPQFRQDYAAGTEVNFNNPACAMRLQDPEGGLWPTADRSWNLRATARFVEALR